VALRLFKRFDLDGNGFLTEEEVPDMIKETYKELGIKGVIVTQEEV